MSFETRLSKALKSKDKHKIDSVFEEIYLEYGKIVCFKIMNYIKNQDVANDLMQDVFVSFFNNLNKIKFDSIKYYLLTSAKNKALDYLKNKNNNIIIDEKYVYDNEELIDYDNTMYKDVISKMKKILSDFEIEIVLKHNLDNLSFKELSKIYDKSVNTILTTYYRAIKKVKDAYKNEK